MPGRGACAFPVWMTEVSNALDWSEGWSAPAKLNLFLHITGRRDDGYHLLQTIFQLLDWGDTLDFRLREDGRIQRVNQVEGVPETEDLTVRAALALQRQSGTSVGADIRLHKVLPMGGGVGGGSSDAATTLLALNLLWGLHWGVDELADLGASLGADIPVFVRGETAWGEGIGEVLSPLELPERWYLVVHPGVHISTAKLFQSKCLTRDKPVVIIADFIDGSCSNVFEPVAAQLYPEVQAVLDWLSEHAGRQSRMTGTGA
ncbi:MAG: 4-(cytidine 5'-diphospho)-2-C-methyl-D-erythritol kinase, partial [Granulosicoccaceae bacterium]